MEIKKKEVVNQTYKVACTSGAYELECRCTVANGAVQNIESGSIKEGDAYLANFSMYGTNLNVNYTAELTLKQQQAMLTLISELKTAVVA